MQNKRKIVLITIGFIGLLGLIIAWLLISSILDTIPKRFAKGLLTLEEPYDFLTQKEFNKEKQSSSTKEGIIQIVVEGYRGENIGETQVSIQGKIKAREKQSQTEYVWKEGDKELLKGSLIRDGQKVAIKCDEIVKDYVGIENVNLQALFENLGIKVSYPIGQIEENSLETFFSLEEIEKQALQEYVTLFSETIPANAYSKIEQKIEINGKEKNVKGYQLTLGKEETRAFFGRISQTIQEDSITLNLIAKRMKTLGFPEEQSTINAIHTRFEEIKQNLQTGKQPVEELTIRYYLWKKKCLQFEIEYGKESIVLRQDRNTNQVSLIWKGNSSGEITKGKKENGQIIKAKIGIKDEIWEIQEEKERKEEGIQSDIIIVAKDKQGRLVIKESVEINAQNEISEIERLTTQNSVMLNAYTKEQLDIILPAIKEQWNQVYNIKKQQIKESF